jgi:hypothetical protein
VAEHRVESCNTAVSTESVAVSTATCTASCRTSRVELDRAPLYCSRIWSLRQVPNEGAVPLENRVAVEVIPFCKTGLKRQNLVGDRLTLIDRIRIQKT